jgi:hypothetical protein
MKKIIDLFKKIKSENFAGGFLATTQYRVERKWLFFWYWKVMDNNRKFICEGWEWTRLSAMAEASYWADQHGFQIRRGVR